MKKIIIILKYNSKRYLYKFLKFILPIIFIISLIMSLCVTSYAVEWKGDGVTLDVYSSYFWDRFNGINRVVPVVDKTSNRSRITFETYNGYAYLDSQLYIFCDVKDIASVYGYFHFQVVGAQQTLSFKDTTGIYTIGKDANGSSVLGTKIIDFQNIDDSNISMYVTSDYPLPDKFIIFINYTHAYNKEVEVRAFDLSYTQHYPIYDNGKVNNDKLKTEQALVKYAYDDFSNNYSGSALVGYLNDNILSGLNFCKSFFTNFIDRIPSLSNILYISLSLGIFGFVFGLLGTVISVSTRNSNKNNKRKGGG